MSKKLSTTVYAVLHPTRRYGPVNEAGIRPVQDFSVDRITKKRPVTKVSELAVRLNLTIDASLFDKISPVIDIELEEGDLFANVNTQVSAEAVPVE